MHWWGCSKPCNLPNVKHNFASNEKNQNYLRCPSINLTLFLHYWCPNLLYNWPNELHLMELILSLILHVSWTCHVWNFGYCKKQMPKWKFALFPWNSHQFKSFAIIWEVVEDESKKAWEYFMNHAIKECQWIICTCNGQTFFCFLFLVF